ncbi:uncharacterized protein LOC130053464 [Ostrea edulis]|uniref:uncharacterized protein LOC130053464 n=1 Tax=Ostrea edulis TaxID=37623 RepID=UPI0024AEEF61|nr:uncharacterized protein LOC130053464 [Ostrea edulis]
MTFHLICSKSDGSENSKLSSYKCNRNRLQQFLLLFTNHFHYISVWIYISFKIVLIYVCFYCEITYQWLFLLFSSFCEFIFQLGFLYFWKRWQKEHPATRELRSDQSQFNSHDLDANKGWFLFSDNENDIDMIEVEKDCDYFSMKKDLSTNDAERKRNKKDSCTLQFTKKTPTIIDLHIFI